jgi:hypothetical protein
MGVQFSWEESAKRVWRSRQRMAGERRHSTMRGKRVIYIEDIHSYSVIGGRRRGGARN